MYRNIFFISICLLLSLLFGVAAALSCYPPGKMSTCHVNFKPQIDHFYSEVSGKAKFEMENSLKTRHINDPFSTFVSPDIFPHK